VVPRLPARAQQITLRLADLPALSDQRVTVPLSAPILAVKALGSFTGAHGAFLLVLGVCQGPRMGTLMVHVYQSRCMCRASSCSQRGILLREP
jgi:hypothetical protein